MKNHRATFLLLCLALLLTAIEYFLVFIALPWIWIEIYQGSILLMTLIMATIIGALPMVGWGYLVCLIGWYGLGAWLGVFQKLSKKL